MALNSPSPRTWVDGEIPPVDTWNNDIWWPAYFMLQPPMLKVRQTTSQLISSGSWQALAFQIEDVDTDGAHSSASNTRITCRRTGWYSGYYGTSWKLRGDAYDNDGRRLVELRQNGSTVIRRNDSRPPDTGNLCVKSLPFGPIYMTADTDYLEVLVYQDSTQNIYTEVGSGDTDTEESPEFYWRWES
jgi:hypothetical protein